MLHSSNDVWTLNFEGCNFVTGQLGVWCEECFSRKLKRVWLYQDFAIFVFWHEDSVETVWQRRAILVDLMTLALFLLFIIYFLLLLFFLSLDEENLI